MVAPLNTMLVKTVATVLAPNSAGVIVEAIPVYESAVPVGDTAAKSFVPPTQMVEDAAGIPIRIVLSMFAQNAAGQVISATVGNIAP